MRPDIVNLRQFYSSRLGRKVKLRLRRLAGEQWNLGEGERIVGIGYATPILRAFRERAPASTIAALMSAAQGAIYWPADGPNRSILADEFRPPFATASLTRIVMLHAFEYAAKPDELLRIAWHLLAPGGRLLLIVPNRHGLWASMGTTPFATGTPYTIAKIKELLNDTEFTLREARAALFATPSAHPLWLRSWGILEFLGHWCFPRIGGVLVIEAEKQIYAAIGESARKPVAAWVATQGAPA